MNQNHTTTMNSQQMQRRPYMNPRGAISRNNNNNNMNNHRMQRMPFVQNHRGGNGINNGVGSSNQNKDHDCFNTNNNNNSHLG